jgi:hypothetical protein
VAVIAILPPTSVVANPVLDKKDHRNDENRVDNRLLVHALVLPFPWGVGEIFRYSMFTWNKQALSGGESGKLLGSAAGNRAIDMPDRGINHPFFLPEFLPILKLVDSSLWYRGEIDVDPM